MQRVGRLLWAMTRILILSKHRSAETFVDFSLQCGLELEEWYRAKSKFHWNRPKSCSASERLLWALIIMIPDLSQRQPKSHFSWRVTRKGQCHNPLCQLSWHWVDTGPGLFWPAPSRWWVVALSESVAIYSKLVLSLRKSLWVVKIKPLGIAAYSVQTM